MHSTARAHDRPEPEATHPGVVVGYDESPAARSALLWAAAESQSRGLPLLVVHVVEAIDTRHPDGPPKTAGVQRSGMRLLADAAHSVAVAFPSVRAWTRLEHGETVEALIALSETAALVTVGIRGRARDISGLLGPTAQRIAAHSASPVAVIPESTGVCPRTGPVVVGLTSTAEGHSALLVAFEEARRRHTRLVCIRSWNPTRPARGNPHRDDAADADGLLLGDLASIRERFADVAVEQILVPDEPADALLEATGGAQLLVLGCRHPEGRWSTRLGPVPVDLLHRVAVPIILVGPDRRPELIGEIRRPVVHRLMEDIS